MAAKWSEEDRLAALERYSILDTDREAVFDDIAELAADLLEAPIAVVNFIASDRQWFKAEVGIGQDSLPLDVSVCRHILLQPGVTVIPDLLADARFDNNPLVQMADGLRFYTGALLETSDGVPLGTVCVLDRVPRPHGITDRQRRALAALASQTMTQLELRRTQAIADEERGRAERRSRRLSLLTEASSLLLSSQNPATIVSDLYAMVAEGFKLDAGFHYRCDGHTLRLVAAYGLTPDQEAASASLRFGDLVCGTVAEQGAAMVVADIQASTDPLHAALKEMGLQSYFSLPLLTGEGLLLGTLSFGRRAGNFTPGEVEALTMLGAQLATALGRSQAEEAVRMVERRREVLLALEEQVRDLADPDALASVSAALLGEALGVCRVGYGEINPAAGTITVGSTWSLPGYPDVAGVHDFDDYGTYLDDLRQDKAVAVADIATDPRTAGGVAALQALGIAAILDVPVVEGGVCTSQILVHASEPRVWTDEEMILVRDVASRTRAAIARRKAEAQLAEREARLALFVDHAPAAIAMFDRDMRYLAHSSRYLHDYRLDPDGSLNGRLHRDVFPDLPARWHAIHQRVLAGEIVSADEDAFPRKDGTTDWVRWDMRPLRNEAGDITGAVLFSEVITDAVQARMALEETEARFRNMADHAPVMMWVTDGQGQCTYLNRLWYEFTGQTPEEAEGLGWLDATHPDDKEEAERIFLAANARQEAFRLDYRLRRADGAYRWCIDAASPRFDAQGVFIGFVGSVIDIDERREAEERLRTSEVRLRTLAEATSAAVWSTDAAGAIVDECPSWAGFTGQTRAEYTGWGWIEAIHPDDRSMVDSVWRGALAARSPCNCEYRLRRADGEYRWTTAHGTPIISADGAVAEWIGANVDITERKVAEDELTTARARLERVLAMTPTGILEFDNRGVFTYANAAADQMLDLASLEADSAATGGGVWQLARLDGSPMPAEEVPGMRALKGEAVTGCELAAVHLGTHKRRILVVDALPVRDQSGHITGGVASLVDVTARNEAERALQLRTDELETLLASSPLGVCFFDREHRWLRINAELAAVNGFPVEEHIGRRIEDLLPVNARKVGPVLDHVFATGETVRNVEVTGETADAPGVPRHWLVSYYPVRDAKGRVVSVGAWVVDITARKEAEAAVERLNAELAARVEQAVAERESALAQLHEAQKLETIGQLTGGVAHDFNNLLTPIVGGLDLLKRRGLPDARSARMVDGALQSAERARLLVQRLLAFARRQHLEARPVDVADLIAGMRDLVERSLGPTIAVDVQITPDLPAALVDPNQLELALLNLCVNARDAMPDGGTLRIAANMAQEPDGDSGAARFVRLSVTDSGVGMDAETLRRCVEPFFTSKGLGKGTGLGLSMVHGLAAQSGGRLQLSSKPGAGTTAELWLPAVAHAGADRRDADLKPPVTASQRQVVLVVDDEELVRESTADMLEELGYEVRRAGSGAEAMASMQADGRIDLLVTDYLMPGMTGAELAAALRKDRPELPVLVVTGYSRMGEVNNSLARLEKPFRQTGLAAAVAELLHGVPAA